MKDTTIRIRCTKKYKKGVNQKSQKKGFDNLSDYIRDLIKKDK